jgi:hypothetical protein
MGVSIESFSHLIAEPFKQVLEIGVNPDSVRQQLVRVIHGITLWLQRLALPRASDSG